MKEAQQHAFISIRGKNQKQKQAPSNMNECRKVSSKCVLASMSANIINGVVAAAGTQAAVESDGDECLAHLPVGENCYIYTTADDV